MVEELNVRNFALIDNAHLDFQKGFTVFSGETGAGKSILIGSLAFLLGGKGGTELIRTGAHEAEVNGTFYLDCKEASVWLEERDIESEDNRVILRRVMKETGKSSAWICGVPVSKADLAEFAGYLVDLHGQHEQQSLMKVSEHRRYLDSYADIVDEVKNFTALYTILVEKRSALSSFNIDEKERRERLDMLKFAVDEIDSAKLTDGEDAELEAEESRLSSFEKLCSDIEQAKALLDGDGDGGSALISCARKLNGIISHAMDSDSSLSNLQNRIQSIFYELDDISGEIEHYSQSLVFDPQRLADVQSRLELIYKLKKKYANQNSTICDIIDYAENARREINSLSGVDSDKSVLEAEITELEKKVYLNAKAISDKRRIASVRMAQAIESVLSKLGMKNAKFNVSMTLKAGDEMIQKCGPYGMDNIEFMISANPGSPLQPLAKVASGGELSRVMLAMKTILSAADTSGTLIFDEIDTGIGGEVAVGVGEHMKLLSQKKQVLCITHLASIAVFADNQIKIQKGVSGNSTSTDVFPIAGENRVREIARMLSGDANSQESLEHAASMLHKFGGT